MDLHTQPKWSVAAVVLAGGALFSAIVPSSRHNAGFDGSAVAARGSVSTSKQEKAKCLRKLITPP
jgi:hypothetical protein